jgi:hypothetical protein
MYNGEALEPSRHHSSQDDIIAFFQEVQIRKGIENMEFVETVVNVRYAETDQMGVVYYANYLVWFEVG